MQSVGEVMSIGRTFPESLQKGMRSLENGRQGLNADPGEQKFSELEDEILISRVGVPTPERLFQLEALLRRGLSIERLYEETSIDPWFIDQISMITEERASLEKKNPKKLSTPEWKRAKQLGFSDSQLAYLCLLYTSPSPRDLSTSRMPSSA